MRTIEKMAFGLAGLTSITIPEGVTEIGERTFYRCDNLESVTLPASLTDISGTFAFGSCPKLGVINFNGTVLQWKSVNIASEGTWWYSAEHIYPYEDWKIVCRDGEVKRYS